MKKVLLGLLALSAVSMAAPTDLTKPAAAGTTIFEASQEGAIGITGTITSTVPTVKYVVFASTDNGTNKEDVLTLTDFILAKDATKAGFVGANPKVYVKKVTSNGVTMGTADLEAADSVGFKLKTADFADASSTTWLTTGSYEVSPTALVAKTMLDTLLTDAALTGVTLDTKGNFVDNGVTYEGNKKVKMTNLGAGVLEITHSDFTHSGAAFDNAKVDAIIAGFATKQAMAAGTQILVKVN